MRPPILPLESRSPFLINTRTIDPGSLRLLAIHGAIAHIVYLSAAGSYVNSILNDHGPWGCNGRCSGKR